MDARIHTATWSDHAPVSMKFKNANSTQKSYLWRVNNYILQQQKNINYVSQKIGDLFFQKCGVCVRPGSSMECS